MGFESKECSAGHEDTEHRDDEPAEASRAETQARHSMSLWAFGVQGVEGWEGKERRAGQGFQGHAGHDLADESGGERRRAASNALGLVAHQECDGSARLRARRYQPSSE